MDVCRVEEVDDPGVGARRQHPVLGIHRGPGEGDRVSRPKARARRREADRGEGRVADGDRYGARGRRERPVGDRQRGVVASAIQIGMRRVRRRRGPAVAEVPRVAERLALGIGATGAREGNGELRLARGRSCARGDHRRKVARREVPDAADLRDAEGRRRVGVAEVDVVERPIRPLAQVDDVAIGAVGGTVGWFEGQNLRDIAVHVEDDPADPVLGVVAEEIVTPVLGGELSPAVDESAGHRRVAAEMRVGMDRVRRPESRARPLAERPAVVGAASCDVDFLLGRRVVVAADVADEEPVRDRVVRDAIGIAQSQGEDVVPVRPRAVEKRVVGRNRAVGVDAKDLATRAREVL